MHTQLVSRAVSSCLLLGLLALPLAAQSSAATTAAAPVANNAVGADYILHHPRVLARFLGLSASQTTSLMGFWTSLQDAVTPLRQARPALCTALEGDLAATTPDPATIGTATLALYSNRDAIIAAREAFNTSFVAILDPAQTQTYDTLKKLAWGGDPDYSPIGQCPRQAS